MSILHSLVRPLRGVAVASLLLVASVSARAGVVVSFDPAFGPTIPNLGYRGTLTLDVTPGCYALGPGIHAPGGGCAITARSAEIDFYNATTNSATLTTVLLPGNFFQTNYVTDGFFDPQSGQLTGIDTIDSNFFLASVTDPTPGAQINITRDFLLYFAIAPFQQIEGFGVVAPAVVAPGLGGAFLVDCGTPGNFRTCNRNSNTNSFPARLTFTTIPEPETLPLALFGLAALVATRGLGRKTSARSARLA